MSEVSELVYVSDAEVNLPESWQLVTLESLVTDQGVFCDGDWVESKDQDPNGDVRLIQLADIGVGSYRDRSDRYLTSEKAAELSCTYLQRGDVLVARMPDPLGRACLFPGDKKKAVTVVDVAIVRPANSKVDSRWLMHRINTQDFRKTVSSLQSGSTRLRISRRNLSKIAFPLPPLSEQLAAVDEIEKQFSRLDEAVANLQRVKANLKRYKAALLKAAVEGRLVETEAELARREGRSYETGEQLLQRILEGRRSKWTGKGKYKEPVPLDATPESEPPIGWTWCNFEQVSSSERHALKAGPFGSALKKEFYVPAGYKIYGQEQVIAGDHKFGDYYIAEEKYKELENCAVKPGDILVSLVGTTGKVLVLPEGAEPGIINPRLIKLSINPQFVTAQYASYYLQSAPARSFFKLQAHGGTMEILNLGIVKALPICLPPQAEQVRIVAEVDRRLSIVREVEAEVDANLQRAQALRSSVLSRAFSGEMSSGVLNGRDVVDSKQLVVKHASRLEPASVVMAARILSDLAGESTMGRVKLQKILFLATYHGKVDAANAEYVRMQAGPLDMPMLEGVIKRLNDLGWFRETARNGKSAQQKAYSYTPLTKAEEHKKHLGALTTGQISAIDQIVRLMRSWTTEQCELLATVYGAWNDLIIWKRPPTVDAIVHEVLENWHEAKRKFSRQQISQMIEQIKRWGVEPSGFGLPTSGSVPDELSKSLFED